MDTEVLREVRASVENVLSSLHLWLWRLNKARKSLKNYQWHLCVGSLCSKVQQGVGHCRLSYSFTEGACRSWRESSN